MPKLKVGDYVKMLSTERALDIIKNEVGVVQAIGPKEDGGVRDVHVYFADYDGFFQYPVYGVSTDFKKVGTKLKWKKPLKLKLGDQVLLSSLNEETEALGAVVGVIDEITDDYTGDTTTFKGKGFEVVVKADQIDEKVPVVE